MSGIEQVRLADCCEIISGATPSTSEKSYWGGEIAWATPKDLSSLNSKYISGTPQTLTELGYSSCSAKLMPAQSVLFSSRAPIGHVAINTIPMCTNQGFKSLVPDPKRVSPDYLYYWLKANKLYLQSLGNGATFKEVSKAIIAEVMIPLPELHEQRRIAAVLDKADALRAKRHEAIAKLDQLLQSVFLEMFGDPVTNPKGWPVSTLGELAEFENGDRSSNYPSKGDIVSEGILFLSTKNITDQRLDLRDTQFITEEKFKSLSRGKIQKGDLVITLRGTLGACCIFDGVYDFAFINAQMMIMRPRLGINSVFLHAVITSAAIQEKIQGSFTGAAVPQLTSGGIAQLGLYRPPTDLQFRFSEIALMLQAHKRELCMSLSLVDDLFQSLQQKGFSGAL